MEVMMQSELLDGYSVIDGQIFDPEGQEFIVKGATIDAGESENIGNYLETWGFNTIQVSNALLGAQTHPGEQGYATNQSIVDAVTAQNGVVIFSADDHSGGYYKDADFEVLKDYWRDMARLYRENPNVWFNLSNNPGDFAQDDPNWVDYHRELIDIIRAEGAENLLLVDAEVGSQGYYSRAVALQAQTLFAGEDNIVLSLQADARWGTGQHLADYLDEIVAADIPVIIGEYGNLPATDSLLETLLETVQSRNIGRVIGTTQHDLTLGAEGAAHHFTGENPEILTAFGQAVWSDLQRPETLNAMSGMSGAPTLNLQSETGINLIEGNAEEATHDLLIGGSGADLITAHAGNDQLFGHSEGDLLVGGLGDDKLVGGEGADTLIGGSGHDIFRIQNLGSEADVIADYEPGHDILKLWDLDFADLTITQGTGEFASDTLITQTSDQHLLAVLSGIEATTITSDDFITRRQTYEIIAGSGTTQIADFGGISDASTLTDWQLQEYDTLQFSGPNFIARNLDLTQVGDDLHVSFRGEADTLVILRNLALTQIDNLSATHPDTGESLGNILFNGQNTPTDRIDVISNDYERIIQLEHTYSVTFLNAQANTVIGIDNSADVINGQEGDDTLTGGSGWDLLRGGTDHDVLYGEEGNDVLEGESGNDVLVGGAGDDTLSGGDGFDQFGLVVDQSIDTITDFMPGVDRFKLAGGLTYSDIVAQQGKGGTANDVYLLLASNQQRLAVLKDTDATQLSATDFISAQQTYEILAGSGTTPIVDFGVVGIGRDFSIDNLAELDTLKFSGTGLTASNLLLSQIGEDLHITFDGVADTEVVLYDFQQRDLDNLIDSTDDPAEIGNLIFDGETVATHRIDVADAQTTLFILSQANRVAFLNEQDNEALGLDDSQDVINGLGGDDTLIGGSGDDVLRGGAGTDSLAGDDGEDTLQGGSGNDVLTGGSGADLLSGELGEDFLVGGDGHDVLLGGLGNDTLEGNYGDDLVNGGVGDDLVNGGLGNDTLMGEMGNDTVYGGTGLDSIVGGEGADLLWGGDGQDTLNGGADDDELVGGNDDDQLFGDEGNDRLAGDAGADHISGGLGDDDVSGGVGQDVLLGDDGADTIQGGAGHDQLEGGMGDDSLMGGAGDDSILGGAGQDSLLGGEGNNLLNGGEGNDELLGGNHADTLIGGMGDDRLTGGWGADLFVIGGDEGVDTLLDFANNTDMLALSDGGGYESLTIVQGIGSQAADSLIYEAGTNRLIGIIANQWVGGITAADFVSLPLSLGGGNFEIGNLTA